MAENAAGSQSGTWLTPRSLEGQTLGKYRVLERLGRGGMAWVYRAYHPQLDRYVAIKVVRPDLVEDPAFVERFRREAQAVAALRHPNIVHVYDFDAQDGIYYMVMELLEGDTLKVRLNDHCARGETIPIGDAARVLLDVLEGLAYAHHEGIVHRDIKPANIMLTQRGQAVLTDFGIAQIVGTTRHTVNGALMGTLNYMAPEQGMTGECDARSDIYAMGIVLYEMLTGRTPFDADTPLAILMKHLHDPLPLPRQLNPGIPGSLERILLRCLAKKAEDRPSSAQKLAEELHRAVEDEGIELPDRISFPLSFTTEEAPAEPVAVLSGTARAKIQDAGFAAGDTDTTLGKRRGARRKAEGKRGRPHKRKGERRRSGLGLAIITVVALIVACNLMGIMVDGVLGGGSVFRRGWPVELFLVSILLSVIMIFTESIYLLIPVGIVLGNGAIFAYYAFTGLWHHWAFLWPLEPFLVGGTLLLTFWLAGRGDRSRLFSRLLGAVTGAMATAMGVGLSWFSLLLSGL